MTYIENVLVCMAAPLLVALLLLRRKQRPLLLFCLAGMGMCLLAAYLNTFFAQLYAADALNAATQIAPVVEEIMKLLPLLFYLAVFEPDAERFRLAAIVVAASFATFENVCYLTQNGAGQFVYHGRDAHRLRQRVRPRPAPRVGQPPAPRGVPVRPALRRHHLPRHL